MDRRVLEQQLAQKEAVLGPSHVVVATAAVATAAMELAAQLEAYPSAGGC